MEREKERLKKLPKKTMKTIYVCVNLCFRDEKIKQNCFLGERERERERERIQIKTYCNNENFLYFFYFPLFQVFSSSRIFST